MKTNSRVSRKKAPIKLSIPAKVAYNADLFKKGIFNLLDDIGCPKCFSGVDCHFTTIQDYILTDKLDVVASNVLGATPQPVLLKDAPLAVSLPTKVSSNIDLVDSAIDRIFDEIGCRACCSGHDIFFQNDFAINF